MDSRPKEESGRNYTASPRVPRKRRADGESKEVGRSRGFQSGKREKEKEGGQINVNKKAKKVGGYVEKSQMCVSACLSKMEIDPFGHISPKPLISPGLPLLCARISHSRHFLLISPPFPGNQLDHLLAKLLKDFGVEPSLPFSLHEWDSKSPLTAWVCPPKLRQSRTSQLSRRGGPQNE